MGGNTSNRKHQRSPEQKPVQISRLIPVTDARSRRTKNKHGSDGRARQIRDAQQSGYGISLPLQAMRQCENALFEGATKLTAERPVQRDPAKLSAVKSEGFEQ